MQDESDGMRQVQPCQVRDDYSLTLRFGDLDLRRSSVCALPCDGHVQSPALATGNRFILGPYVSPSVRVELDAFCFLLGTVPNSKAAPPQADASPESSACQRPTAHASYAFPDVVRRWAFVEVR